MTPFFPSIINNPYVSQYSTKTRTMEVVTNVLSLTWHRMSVSDPLAFLYVNDFPEVVSLVTWGLVLTVYGLFAHVILQRSCGRLATLLASRVDVLAVVLAALWYTELSGPPARPASVNTLLQRELLKLHSNTYTTVLGSTTTPSSSFTYYTTRLLSLLFPALLRLRGKHHTTVYTWGRVASITVLYLAPAYLYHPLERDVFTGAAFWVGLLAYAAFLWFPAHGCGVRYSRDPRLKEVAPMEEGAGGRCFFGVERFSHHNLWAGVAVGAGNTAAEVIFFTANLPWIAALLHRRLVDTIPRYLHELPTEGPAMSFLCNTATQAVLAAGQDAPLHSTSPYAVPSGVLKMFGREQRSVGSLGCLGDNIASLRQAGTASAVYGVLCVVWDVASLMVVAFFAVYAGYSLVVSFLCACSNVTRHEKYLYGRLSASQKAPQEVLKATPTQVRVQIPLYPMTTTTPLGIRLGGNPHLRGVFLSHVSEASPSAEAGLGEYLGQRITSINGTGVMTVCK